jgi:hypothetical protein
MLHLTSALSITLATFAMEWLAILHLNAKILSSNLFPETVYQLRFLVVVLSPFRQMLGFCLSISHDNFHVLSVSLFRVLSFDSTQPKGSTLQNKTRPWTRSWATFIHLPFPQPVPLRSVLMLCSHFILGLPSDLSQRFSQQNCARNSCLVHPSRIPIPTM